MELTDLIDKLSATSGLDTQQTRGLLDSFVESLRKCCKEGDAVAIPGFGTFQPNKTDEHIAVNTDTGKRTLYPPSVTLTLKSSVVLRKKLLG